MFCHITQAEPDRQREGDAVRQQRGQILLDAATPVHAEATRHSAKSCRDKPEVKRSAGKTDK